MRIIASQNKLHALLDWIQIQIFSELTIDCLLKELLWTSSEYFFEKQGRLEYYDYDRVMEYSFMRLYFHSSGEKTDYMLVLSGKALEFFQEEILMPLGCTIKDFLLNVFYNTQWGFKILRIDPAIDDWNQIPYFTPCQLMKVCERKRFTYGKSTWYDVYGLENKEKGMTIYLKPPQADDRIKFYDKQSEEAKRKGVRKKDIQPRIRTEIVFRREKAHEFIYQYLFSDGELIDLVKGYLKEKVKFYSDDSFQMPLRSWQRFLGKSRPLKISIPKTKSGLLKKFDWFFYQGSIGVYKAYLFCVENQLLTKEERQAYEEHESMFSPDLSSELQKRATEKGRSDLIEEIVERTKKPPLRKGT